MQESSVMTEIRKIKAELSNKARGMSRRDFLDFIKKEAKDVKETIKVNFITK